MPSPSFFGPERNHMIVHYIFCRVEFLSNALRHFNFPEEHLEKDLKSQDFFPNAKQHKLHVLFSDYKRYISV